MKRIATGLCRAAVPALGVLAIMGFARGPKAEPIARPHGGIGGRVPVLVELFTSEGCSSCPPADVVLAALQKDQPVDGAQVIALGEHVDYWNYIGWNDPFSSGQFSDRQRSYARTLRLESVYTPQIVVDGQLELLGSDRGLAQRAVDRARRVPHADVRLERVPAAGAGPDRIRVSVETVPGARTTETADVVLAFTENNLRSSVVRGENAGRNLAHAAVVRQMRVLGSLTPGRPYAAEEPLTIQRGWKPADLSAVVFIQERSTHRVLGAAILSLDNTPGPR